MCWHSGDVTTWAAPMDGCWYGVQPPSAVVPDQHEPECGAAG